MVGGGVTLVWYDELSKDDKERADRIAANYANQLYGKSAKELTRAQSNRVAELTKQHFTN
jgi:hypothetical protein